MQPDPVADQLRRQHVAFDGLADEEYGGDDGDRDPAIELREREADREHQADQRAEVGNEGEEAGDEADHQAELEAGERQPDRVEHRQRQEDGERQSVVEGKSVSVRVDLGGSSIIKKKKKTNTKMENTAN